MTLPDDLLQQQPMLASPAGAPAAVMLERLVGRYVFDVKWDGIRCLAYVTDGRVRLISRRMNDITFRYPDVVANLATTFPAGEYVFDGELVVFNGERFDFGLALKRDAQAKLGKIRAMAQAHPACFMAFDLLWADGDLRREPLGVRLGMLRKVLDGDHPGVQVSQTSASGKLLWEMVDKFGLEGVVAKAANAPYTAGRSASWIKIKRTHRCTAIVYGYDPGEGGRLNQVGALHLALLENGHPRPVGKVGTGFKAGDHAPMLEILNSGQEFLVEVEYLEATKEHQLRHPSYKGVRVDITREECTVEQLAAR